MADKEYIEREAVLNHADIITVHTREYGSIDVIPVDCVSDIPAADVVEVVRCKDCVCGRHPNKNDRFEALYPLEYLYCCVHECGVKKDGYCSYGKRKGQK